MVCDYVECCGRYPAAANPSSKMTQVAEPFVSSVKHAAARGWCFGVRLISHLDRWLERMRQRRSLALMSDRDLKDIGINRYDALKEWEKPFWRD